MPFTNNTLLSDNVWTSEILVQAHQRFNVNIWIGSLISFSDVVLSTASAIVTLQRQMANDPTDVWRDVETWTILLTDAQDGNSEDVSDKPEPETCKYRLGCKNSEYYSGAIYGRMGTS